MADLAINLSLSLVDQIINFTTHLRNEQKIQGNVTGDLGEVKAHLKTIEAYVQSGNIPSELEEVLVQRLRVVAYRIEDALDGIMLHEPHYSPTSILVRKPYEWFHYSWHKGPLLEIHEEIQKIRREIDEIQKSLALPHGASLNSSTELHHHLSQTLEDDNIPGIEVSKKKLVSQLINEGERNCSVVVVVGPPGSGKTVLANSVYNSDKVIRRFSCKVGVRVSCCFDVNVLLGLLLSQCSNGKTRLTGDYVTDLRNSLQRKRYLILLDDVWSETHWRAIKRALPEDANGSRVVITTTKLDVASSIATSRDHIHIVEGLQEEDSWQLFCRKAFRDEQGVCPPDLVELSRRILHKCEGSSLAISAVGGLLARKHRWPAEWTKVYENLRAETESNPQFSDLNNSMLQSYDDLHCNLKRCLLYFSLFPEGCYIERARLIRLWVAERFVIETGGKPAEDLAEEYLNELIKRHLVVACKDFDGRVKNCRVRNFLLYFLIARSRKEDFASILDKTSAKPGENVRRLSVIDALSGVGIKQLQIKRVCTGIIMSGIVFQNNEVCNQLKYLKVLDFQGAPLQNFPECVTALELLRYLSLRGSTHISGVPVSIKKLRYLEFLDLKHTSVICLPKEICLLHNLRHLLVYHYGLCTYVTFDTAQGMKMPREIGTLNSLRKLTLLKAENHWKFFDQLGKLTQLQKLGLIELRKTDGKYLCKSLANMEHLSVLDLRSMNKSEYLDLDYPSSPCNLLQRVYLKGPLQKLPSWIKSLRSLVRIHLRWSRLTTSPLDELQGLNTLIELHLVDAFIGVKLKFARDAFENLKVLHLEALAELSKVKASSGSLRNLQSLTLCNCGQLKTLPSRIQRLSHLKEVVLSDMPVELTNNLRESGMDCSKIKVYYFDASSQTWLEQVIS